MSSDKLHVEFESTPAAWCAYYDPESYIGRGNTREDAIIDLMEQEIDGSATREAKLKRALAEEQKRIREAVAIFKGFRAGCSICDDEGHELDWRDIDRRCKAAIDMLEAQK